MNGRCRIRNFAKRPLRLRHLWRRGIQGLPQSFVLSAKTFDLPESCAEFLAILVGTHGYDSMRTATRLAIFRVPLTRPRNDGERVASGRPLTPGLSREGRGSLSPPDPARGAVFPRGESPPLTRSFLARRREFSAVLVGIVHADPSRLDDPESTTQVALLQGWECRRRVASINGRTGRGGRSTTTPAVCCGGNRSGLVKSRSSVIRTRSRATHVL